MFRTPYGKLCYFNRVTDLTVTILSLNISPSRIFISTTTTATNYSDTHSFRVSYLINSCGLSEQAAISASKRVHFETSEKPDLVISFFRDYEFSDALITKIIRVHPNLLLFNTDKTLKPKLEFFRSAGASYSDLAQIIFRDPGTLLRSLENQIIPSFEFLRGMVETKEAVVKIFKIFPRNSFWGIKNYMIPNIAALRHHGVPEALIPIILWHPSALLRRPERFNEIIKEVKEMGFDPLEASFLSAACVIAGLSKSTWKAKLDILGKWGWTEDEILSAFRKQPILMKLSEKKIVGAMDFFVNTMGLEPSVVAKCPTVLTYSLDKTIIPRCSVIQVLLSKGLIAKDLSLTSVIIRLEETFLERFVIRYIDQVPQLLKVYQGQIDWKKCSN